MKNKFAVIFLAICVFFCFSACSGAKETGGEKILQMTGTWVLPDNPDKTCSVEPGERLLYEGCTYTMKRKATLKPCVQYDLLLEGTKKLELQVFDGTEHGYDWILNIGTPTENGYAYLPENAGYVNLDQYERIDITADNLSTYFETVDVFMAQEETDFTCLMQYLALREPYDTRIKPGISTISACFAMDIACREYKPGARAGEISLGNVTEQTGKLVLSAEGKLYSTSGENAIFGILISQAPAVTINENTYFENYVYNLSVENAKGILYLKK